MAVSRSRRKSPKVPEKKHDHAGTSHGFGRDRGRKLVKEAHATVQP